MESEWGGDLKEQWMRNPSGSTKPGVFQELRKDRES